MSETANQAVIGELAFDRIFKTFGWRKTGPTNTNWPCVSTHGQPQPKKAKKKKPNDDDESTTTTKTHPTDAVWYYDDPYRPTRIFVNADFKSYGKSTLDRVQLSGSLRSLSATVACANQSAEFQTRFYQDSSGETVGLLFVYNHDNEYEPEKFRKALKAVPDDAQEISRGCRMFVIGPDRIRYLLTVATDMTLTGAERDTKNFEASFFLPDLIGHPTRYDHDALSLESLLGPWQILKLTGVTANQPDVRYHIYLDGNGGTPAEHEYLIDYLFRYQLLEGHSKIFLRFVQPDGQASVHLQTAKRSYVERLMGLNEFSARLDKIEFRSVPVVQLQFSDIAIGMGHE